MKRLLSLTMAGILMLSATAFGATVEEAATASRPILEKKENGFSVTYSDATANKEYMVWVLKGVKTAAADVSFTQSDVMYVDQVTAKANGAAFNGFLPMKSVDSTVVITGQGMEAPVIVGYIKAEGNLISGYIGLTGRTKNFGGAELIFTNVETGEATDPITTNENNYFETMLPNGTYTLTITKDGYLSYTDKTYEVSSESGWTEEISLVPGDLNNNGKIELMDYGIFRSNFGSRVAIGDLNGNGQVELMDYGIFRSNFGASKTVIE